ncbi:uncharacterized protein HKW66_Vig0114500 [Vigna angularis]|uniref:SKP1 component dimerisation domain-containing protein n=1 Tax=Phaseolus angularis TaxID=3914 RepID=A0A8T0L094_PHAAN|nr:uncharacterized protein HKW66_Vig0114500 [Vigna angularis]
MLKKTEGEKSQKGKMMIVGDESNAEYYEEGKKLKLETSDGLTMEVEISIVKEMEMIRPFIKDADTDNSVVIPLFDLHHDELMEMLRAANDLDLKTVFFFICSAIVEVIQDECLDVSQDFVRDFFDIMRDISLDVTFN